MDIIRGWATGNPNLEEDLNVMRNKADALFARADDISTEVRNEELHPGKKRRREVNNWMDNAKDIKRRIDCIEEEVKQGSLLNRKSLRNQILKITKEIEELLEKAGFQNGLTILDLASSSLPLLTTDMKGQQFEKNLRMILSWLMADEVSTIGVYGVGGVGKTTLAMHIHNQLLQFLGKGASVYWVTVSKDCTLSKLQENIAKELGLSPVLKEADNMKRPAILAEALKKRNNVVVILDDMWECFPAENVGLPTGKNRCKLLLTTRSLEVCRKMGCQKSVKVETLSEEESWSLFIESLGNCDDLSLEAKDIAKLVVKKCASLPLGIKVVAGSMIGVFDVYEWNNTLIELTKSTRTHEGLENEVFPSLQLSYTRLNNVKLQNCFLSCALYPEDYELYKTILVDRWIMEGHLDEIKSRHEQWNMAHTMLNRLINASLLDTKGLTGSFVQMHDLIRDMAIKISREEHHAMIKAGMQLREVPRLQEWTEKLTKVSLFGNKITEIPSGLTPRCPNISSLLLAVNPLKTIPDSFFLFLNGLRYLDLSATLIQRVPDCISNLENLSALNVSSCENLVYIPSLAKLAKLRHLVLTYCSKIVALPKGMENLVNLECLLLSWCDKLCVTFSELTLGLPHIQCLELSCGVKDAQIRDLQKLGCLESLTDFRIPDTGNFNTYVESHHFHQLTSYRLILGSSISISPWDFVHDRIIIIDNFRFSGGAGAESAQLPRNLQELQILSWEFQVRSLDDALPSLTGLTRLKKIFIHNCAGIEYVWSQSSCARPTLESLEELVLGDLRSFRALAKGRVELPSGALSNLKILHVEDCDRTEKLFTPCLIKGHFRNLEEIRIQGCGGLEEIFEGSELDGESGDANTMMILELPKLRVLHLSYLRSLVSIGKIGLDCYKSIEEITVLFCPQLNKLPLLLQVLKNGMPSAPPCLRMILGERDWWESLSWDNPQIKHTLQPFVRFYLF